MADSISAGLTRRGALGLIGASTVTAAVAACGPITSGGPTPAGSPAAGTAKRGGTLRFGSINDVNNIDVQSMGLQATKDILWQTTEPLVDIDREFKHFGVVAQSWEFSSDQKQVKFNLRKNVQFHTGREMDSEDVKVSYLRINNPKLTQVSQNQVGRWIQSFELPDKSTIVMKLDAAHPGLLDSLGNIKIADRVQVEQPGAGAAHSSGTGPFKITRWNPKQNMTLVRHEGWWGAGASGAVKRPYLDGIEFTVYPDAQAMVIALESGAIDWADIPPTRDAKRLMDADSFVLQWNSRDVSAQFHRWVVNSANPPTTDKRVRQAIQYACDRKRILDSVMLGLGHTRYLPFPEKAIQYDPAFVSPYPFDLAKAQALVREANAVGSTLEFHIDNTRTEAVSFGQIWADDLQKAGFKVNLQFMTPIQQNELSKQGKHNIKVTGGAGSNVENVGGLQGEFGAQAVRTPPLHQTNLADPKLQDLIDKQLAVELDVAKRKALYKQIYAIVVDNAVDGAVVGRFPSALTTKKVMNVNWQVIDNVRIEDVWLDQ